MLIPLCDLCKMRMTNEEVIASAQVAGEYIKAVQCPQNLVTEILCAKHRDLGPDFWSEKALVMAEAAKEYERRLENHRNRFLASRLKAVSK
jgi:hypothetical protein